MNNDMKSPRYGIWHYLFAGAIMIGASAAILTAETSPGKTVDVKSVSTVNVIPSPTPTPPTPRPTPAPTVAPAPVHGTAPRSATPTPTYTYKPYVASVCTKTPLPYKTTYEEKSYMTAGETKEYGGTDGYIETCTADSTGYKPMDRRSEPYDKVVYIGTSPPTPSAADLAAVRQQKIAACVRHMNSIAPNSSAYLQCYSAY